ncbi:hypothetical protein FV232_26180 [Methylobacterium sp. WL30]|uniref:hypothetical protein n=1 Tax=unclassified Methylobacterium TaxID=2615210 RepID=UPI0011CC8185|nr:MULTISPECIES: hypothetical protein [unclassified Methylobacterium]TXM94908.1 hypothetical protein FV223_02900 [Methylobacterium sp. WL116]TXN39337.1 hypothetical protein FV225_10135 [Methylobacterium sp. WL93]TXN45798.1 hypothetical protein FV227_24515 [Methylobacterium sp. WL119]TXN62068.1 hypothetical protein FV232_26180 [Methylobacterium sp. WL30]
MYLLRIACVDYPHGRAKPAPVQPLRDVAFICSGNLHRHRITPYEAQIAPHSLFELRPHRAAISQHGKVAHGRYSEDAAG